LERLHPGTKQALRVSPLQLARAKIARGATEAIVRRPVLKPIGLPPSPVAGGRTPVGLAQSSRAPTCRSPAPCCRFRRVGSAHRVTTWRPEAALLPRPKSAPVTRRARAPGDSPTPELSVIGALSPDSRPAGSAAIVSGFLPAAFSVAPCFALGRAHARSHRGNSLAVGGRLHVRQRVLRGADRSSSGRAMNVVGNQCSSKPLRITRSARLGDDLSVSLATLFAFAGLAWSLALPCAAFTGTGAELIRLDRLLCAFGMRLQVRF